jgi:hypothetical protein
VSVCKQSKSNCLKHCVREMSVNFDRIGEFASKAATEPMHESMLDAVEDMWRAYQTVIDKKDSKSDTSIMAGYHYLVDMVQLVTRGLLNSTQQDDAEYK